MTTSVSANALDGVPPLASSEDNRHVEEHPVSTHVMRATYPLPEPLVRRLLPPPSDSVSQSARVVEDFSTALSLLVGNSIEALDRMYFDTPARLRRHFNQGCLSHRLCIRVKACADTQTLSLTDLGSGMTRADLINSLGIGGGRLRKSDDDVETPSDGEFAETEDSTDDEVVEEEYDDEKVESHVLDVENPKAAAFAVDMSSECTEKSEEDATTQSDSVAEQKQLSCLAADVGGFYAALCSLGTGVCVKTKSKFDDLYKFQLGCMEESDWNNMEKCYSEFCITRPYKEGTELSSVNGFDKFEDIRGDCGTCVCIRLNEAAIKAGLLNEENVLKPLFLKIVETTQYTVAFSSDQQSAQAIIDASAQEKVLIQKLQIDNDMEDDALMPFEVVNDMNNAKNGQQSLWDAADSSHDTVKERAKYIPLRLSLGERKMLRLVEACMNTCDYTTYVDRPFKSPARRTHEQLKGVTGLLRGLVTACDYQAGQKLLQDDNFAEYQTFFKQMFEIARRHKIMNPEKMRTEYGKLVYILQDAVSPAVRPHLGFSVKSPIESVYKFLEDRNGLELLSDKVIESATEEILAGRKSRSQIDNQIRIKERAVNLLKKKYRSHQLSPDDIHLCLYSICDNNSFLNSNRLPIDKIIDYLTSHFSPTEIEPDYSLSIVSGEDGARLSHSHERQYYFALQSLTLWRDIINDMFRLWAMAEDDLLSESVTYSIQDTGQGMQRVQQSPRTYQSMQQILHRVQHKVSKWVGSSVIHMGDHNVPNALSFIDKYTQVPRILGPIVACLENLDRICEKDSGIEAMINHGFGGQEKLKKDILYDFFRFAFDGSGADNFYDAGSCIDGRLTSAWNWCSQLPNKPFYAIFKLTGFIGFDGEFK